MCENLGRFYNLFLFFIWTKFEKDNNDERKEKFQKTIVEMHEIASFKCIFNQIKLFFS
jgi:hypothetical protein